MGRLLERVQRFKRDEAGMAMIVAVLVVMLMTLIPLAMFSQAVQQLPLARHDQDHEMALTAAEAGVDDYLNHLAQNQNYWTYNKTNLPPAPDSNSATSVIGGVSYPGGAFKNWIPVPGPKTSTPNEQFRYSVDASQTSVAGLVYITSSGRSRGVIRTVKVGLRRQGFLDYLWLTDYEITDPVLSGANASQCKFRAWQYNSGSSVYGPNDWSACQVVYWNDQAVLNGPVHSNDGLYVCGNPTINGNTDTYYNSRTSGNVPNSLKFGGPGAIQTTGCGVSTTPNWSRTGDPASGALLPFPPANTAIKSQADGALGGTGCLYTGNTTIVLKSTGKMDVTSPKTKSTNSGCGTTACLTSGCTNLNLPTNGVIYVQTVPTSSGDPNYSSCSGTACTGDVSSLSGTLNGQLTIASQNDIVITGTVQYHQYPGGTDVLGLTANNNVAVYHPISGSNNGTGSITDPRIDAAILALNHSFYVQNWSTGATLGTLTINGVIAQEFRGPVGTFNKTTNTQSTGYAKSYNYDTRLKYLSPPYFLSPTSSSWGRISYAEMRPNPTP